jgi:hypothetical protein
VVRRLEARIKGFSRAALWTTTAFDDDGHPPQGANASGSNNACSAHPMFRTASKPHAMNFSRCECSASP